jgi:hypothetical protein
MLRLQVDIRARSGAITSPELVQNILDDKNVKDQITKANLHIAGSLISQATQKGSAWFNPDVFEAEFAIRPSASEVGRTVSLSKGPSWRDWWY